MHGFQGAFGLVGNGRIEQPDPGGGDKSGQRDPERPLRESVQGHGHGTVEMVAQFTEYVIGFLDEYGVAEKIAKQHRADGQETDHHRGNRQQHQRQGHDPGRLVRCVGQMAGLMMAMVIVMRVVPMPVLVLIDHIARLAVEGHVQQAEAVQRGDEHAGQHAEIRIAGADAMRLPDRLDDGVLGEESGEPGSTGQGQ